MTEPRPKRLLLLGNPVAHSLSPAMQNAALRAAGIPLEFEAIAVRSEDLGEYVSNLASQGAAGNVTIPHKVAFLPLCASVTPIAARVGAVNTFWTDAAGLAGDNTDVEGFDRAARSLIRRDVSGMRVALLGAGGAAAAVLGAIESWRGATVTIFARHAPQAESLSSRFKAFTGAETTLERAVLGANLVVNATPVGMHDETELWNVGSIPREAAVMDLVYRKGGTKLVRSARAAGLQAADGTEMLLEQGALSFERWFGFPPDKDVMRAALE